MSRAAPRATFPAATIHTLTYEQSLSEYIRSNAFAVGLESLSDSGWTLSNQGVQQLLDKLRAAGTPLGEYVQGKIYYGIKTGLNEAFVIDAATRDRLIAEDGRSAEVIKPFLSGKEIKKYQTITNTHFLIFTKRGTKIEEFPAIKKYLSQFKERLEPKPKNYQGNDWPGRKDGSYQWFEIQDSIDYFKEFEKSKIVWPETSFENQFCYVDKGVYLNKTTFFLPIEDHSLLGILNSKVIKFCLNAIVSKMRGGYFSMSKAYVETVPIPDISTGNFALNELVTRILTAKQSNPQSDTTALEAEVDALVYGLYGLTEEEIGIVEGG
jgi:hypothetical protein